MSSSIALLSSSARKLRRGLRRRGEVPCWAHWPLPHWPTGGVFVVLNQLLLPYQYLWDSHNGVEECQGRVGGVWCVVVAGAASAQPSGVTVSATAYGYGTVCAAVGYGIGAHLVF